MKNVIIFLPFILSLFCACDAQSAQKNLKNQDTTKVFLYGTIRDQRSKDPFEYANYWLTLTDTGSISHSAVRRGGADKSGKFKIDITTLLDSTKTLVIRCKFINCALTHVIIKGKIKQSVQVDIELIEGRGDFYTYYKVNPKNTKLKQTKQVVNVSNNGY